LRERREASWTGKVYRSFNILTTIGEHWREDMLKLNEEVFQERKNKKTGEG